jgi:ABC-type antimicrobial peptide transport system permease subunit
VLVLTSVGIVIGLLGALALGRFVASQLLQVEPTELLTLSASVALVLMMATVSAWLPTRRISPADPLETLKAE